MCALSTYWLGRRRACSCVVSTHFLIWVVFFFFDNIVHILFVVFFVVFLPLLEIGSNQLWNQVFFGFLLCAQLSQISFFSGVVRLRG